MGSVVDAVGDIVGGAVDAVGSAIGSVAEGVGGIIGGGLDAIGGLPSIFGDVLEGVGGVAGGIFDAVGGVVGGAAEFLNPLNFFENVGNLAGDLLPGPLGDIAQGVLSVPGNIASAIGDFAGNIFGGDLIGAVGDLVPGLVPGGNQGAETLLGAFETNLNQMNGIFDQITNLDPNSPTYQADLLRLQHSLEQLTQANTMISQMMAKLNELSDRIIQNMR